MNSKYAKVFAKGNILFIHPQSVTTKGIIIFSEPVVVRNADGELKDLGKKIIEILNQSIKGVKHPENWGGILKPLIKVAKSKTISAFMSGIKCVSIILEDNKLILDPFENLGMKKGFISHKDRVIVIESFLEKTPEEIGNYIIEAINVAK